MTEHNLEEYKTIIEGLFTLEEPRDIEVKESSGSYLIVHVTTEYGLIKTVDKDLSHELNLHSVSETKHGELIATFTIEKEVFE